MKIDLEKTLLIKLKDGDKDAFKTLFYNYYNTVLGFVNYKVLDIDLANDITQETFIRIWKSHPSIKPNKSFFSFAARISSNLCNDHFRHLNVRIKNKDGIAYSNYQKPPSPELINDEIELKKRINYLVNTALPKKCQNIFFLSRVEKKKNKEIAHILGISIRTVENQLYRSLKILKKHLKEYF